MIGVVYVYNVKRAHKVLPLLEGLPVTVLKRRRDVFGLKRPSGGARPAVLVDAFGQWGVLGVVASLVLRAPLVIRLRGEYFREERERVLARPGRFRWLRYLGQVAAARLCLLKASMVIYNSHYLAAAMASYARGKPWAVVHNPFTLDDAARPAGKPLALPVQGFHLLTVTNMNLHSKVQPMLEAIDGWIPPKTWEELDLHWVICGTGYHEERLRTLVREKGLEGRVHLLGRIQGIASAYEWADVLVHLTRLDAFPNAPMEAMVYGSPVIANADSCGTREQVFDGVNGFVVNGAASFVSALKAYAKDPALRERHARAGRSLVEDKFSVDVQHRAMKQALSALVSYDW